MAFRAFREQRVLNQEQLWAELHREFDRLNAAHCDGKLTRPEIVLSTRKTYGGYYQPARHRIVLSWQAYREHGWEETLNTFRHEVAHIVHPNHARPFWLLAERLGCTRRHASAPLVPRKTTLCRYVYECPCCQRRLLRRRRLRKASCGACDEAYNPQFALRLVKA